MRDHGQTHTPFCCKTKPATNDGEKTVWKSASSEHKHTESRNGQYSLMRQTLWQLNSFRLPQIFELVLGTLLLSLSDVFFVVVIVDRLCVLVFTFSLFFWCSFHERHTTQLHLFSQHQSERARYTLRMLWYVLCAEQIFAIMSYYTAAHFIQLSDDGFNAFSL